VVLLPGIAGVVVAIAEELDGQPVLGPAAVDVSAAGDAVGLRQWQAGFPQPLEEATFELAEREVHVAAEDPSEVGCPWRSRTPRERGFNLVRCCLVLDRRLVDRAGEVFGTQGCREVHQCPGHCRDWNSSKAGDVSGIQVSAATSHDSFDPALRRRCHFRRRRFPS